MPALYVLFLATALFGSVATAQEFIITPLEDVTFKEENGENTVIDKKGSPFSGAVVKADDEGRKVTYFYRNGKLDGQAFSHYEDGKLEMAVNYRKGVKDGDAVFFYDNEKYRLKQTYKNGKLDGEEIVYYENGKPQYVRHYKDDKLDGEVLSFDENGNVKLKEHYKAGVKNGIEHIIADNMLMEEHNYVDGKYDGLSKIYNDKYLEEEINYKNGVREGISKKYMSDGSRTETEYKNGLKNGVAFAYFPDNKVKEKAFFANGVKNGQSEFFYENGQRRSTSIYKDGKKEGITREYSEDGDLLFVRYFVADVEMANVNVKENEEISEIYQAYKLGTLGKFSTKKNMWYPLLWLGLNLENTDIFKELEKNMAMYNASVADSSVYKKESKTKYPAYVRNLFFGLTPLSYAVDLFAPTEILQKFATDSANIEEKNPRGGTALQEAIRLNNLKTVQFLILKKADAVTDFKSYGSVLHYAFNEKADLAVMDELLKSGADINAKNADGYSLLMLAIENNNSELVNLLLQNKADITEKTPDGNNLADFAYGKGIGGEILDKLLYDGIDVNEKNSDGELLITEAIRKNDVDFVKKLLTANADVNLIDGTGYNAVALVLQPEFENMADLLYEKEVNLGRLVPAKEKTLWRELLDKQRLDLLEKQFAEQNNVRQPDEKGDEPLAEMLKMSDEKVREFALKNISSVLINEEPKYLSLVLKLRDLDLWKAFIAKGFNPEIKIVDGDTMLLYLLKNGYSDEFAEVLSVLKPDVNAEDAEKNSPFDIVLHAKNIRLIKDFISEGADINKRKDGIPYLAEFGVSEEEQTQLLLDAGADTNFVAAHGKTLLMFAVENLNEPLIVNLLAKAPNEAEVRDDNGNTAYMYLVEGLEKNKDLPSEELQTKIKSIASKLFEKGVQANARGSSGETVLIRLAQHDKELYRKFLQVFKELGVDETITDQYGKTAADY